MRWGVWGRGVVCTGLWWGSMKEREHLENIDVNERIIF